VSLSKLREEFSFIKGNYLILIISWILMDFANELPGTYYSDYVKNELGGSATILGIIMFASLIALASVQFLGGYLADVWRSLFIHPLRNGTKLAFPLDWSNNTEPMFALSTSAERHDGRFTAA
jgi:MFS family permease